MSVVAHNLYIRKSTNDLQSDQTGEALEDVYVETADAVVGQVPVAKKIVLGLFLPHLKNNTTRQLQ